MERSSDEKNEEAMIGEPVVRDPLTVNRFYNGRFDSSDVQPNIDHSVCWASI